MNNWTIIDKQAFEYEAVCNGTVEGELQPAGAARLSDTRVLPFVPTMACCVLTLEEAVG